MNKSPGRERYHRAICSVADINDVLYRNSSYATPRRDKLNEIVLAVATGADGTSRQPLPDRCDSVLGFIWLGLGPIMISVTWRNDVNFLAD